MNPGLSNTYLKRASRSEVLAGRARTAKDPGYGPIISRVRVRVIDILTDKRGDDFFNEDDGDGDGQKVM